jgi:tRNA 2-thiouridine synthesizing protein D
MAKTLSILIMDPPYESGNTVTAFRIVESALRKGHNVNVFAYEGATSLTLKSQKKHPNSVKGTALEEEDHPLTKDIVTGLFGLAKEKGAKLTWINCGLCVDERGVEDWVDGPVRGGPPDFVKAVNASDNSLVIATN